MYGVWDLTHNYVWLSMNRCRVFWRYLKTHRYCYVYSCITSKLPDRQGYRWESLCCPQPWTLGSTRGPRGVAVLYKKELHDRATSVIQKGCKCTLYWIQIKRGELRELYIAICYFPPDYSSPWITISITIWHQKISYYGGHNTIRRIQCTNYIQCTRLFMEKLWQKRFML